MKKLSLCILLLTVSLFLYSLEADDEWKQSFSSPTYGIAFLFADISGSDEGYSDTLLLKGLDARIFMGKNVSQKGGFFNGFEVGAYFFPSGEDASFSDSYTDSGSNTLEYEPILDYTWAMVFLLAKYGYRLEFGTPKLGFSIGGDTGIGIRLGNGQFNLSITEDDATAGVYWSAIDYQALLDFLLDINLETSVRFGKNFRIFLIGGISLTPLSIPGGTDQSEWSNNESGLDFSDGADDAELYTIVNRYRMDFAPVIGSIRIGFILNY